MLSDQNPLLLLQPNLTTRMIELVEQVVLRELTSAEKQPQLAKLVTECRYVINWRANLHTEQAANAIWVRIKSGGIDTELLLNMTNEWIFRASLTQLQFNELTTALLNTLSWTSLSKALPQELVSLAVKEDALKAVLKNNPWVTFLYLVSVSDLLRLIQAQKPPSSPPAKK